MAAQLSIRVLGSFILLYPLATLLTVRNIVDAVHPLSCEVQKTGTTHLLKAVVHVADIDQTVSFEVPPNWEIFATPYKRAYKICKGITLTAEAALLLWCLESKAFNALEHAQLNNGQLTYKLKNRPLKKVNDLVEAAEVTELTQHLNAVRSLVDGYLIEEVKGAVIYVKTPGGFSRKTSVYECDCSRFLENPRQPCEHINLVRSYVQERSLWQEVGAAKLL